MLKKRVIEAVVARDWGMQNYNSVVQDGLTINVHNDDGRRTFQHLQEIVLQLPTTGG